MTKLNQIYKCKVCGNIVEVTHTGAGELVCCNEPMKLQEENTEDLKRAATNGAHANDKKVAATEKHVPVVEKTDKGYKVTVGETKHPMEESHYIEWIELIADGRIYRQHLKPGAEPAAEFCVQADEVTAREYCNLHGLWKK